MTQSEIALDFQGLSYGRDPVPAFSARRPLNVPRELLNLIHDEHGQLWLPPVASTVFHDFGATGTRIHHLANFASDAAGIGLLVQLDNAVYVFDTSLATPAPVLLVSDVGTDRRIWVNITDTAVYFGTPSGTWRLTQSAGTYTVVLLDPLVVPTGFHSYSYKGRRFVVRRNVTIKFSEINDPEVFLADSEFTVGGDQTGGSWEVSPGSVVALMEIEDVLLIFCTQSVWALVGSHPENFRLRRTNSLAGCWARDSLARVDEGIMFVGGTPRGELGVYLFTGNDARLVSPDIAGFFRDWTFADGSFSDATMKFTGTRWRDRYHLSASDVDASRQVYSYDLRAQTWSTHSGWVNGPATGLVRYGGTLDRLLMSNGNVIYGTYDPIARAPAAPDGQVTLGWHDQGQPTGLVRFLGLKVGVWSTPTAGTLTAALSVPGGASAPAETVAVDFHDHAVLPLNLRGKAVEIDLTIAAPQALLESIELVLSRKGSKLSRG